jgi:hypothetical protein
MHGLKVLLTTYYVLLTTYYLLLTTYYLLLTTYDSIFSYMHGLKVLLVGGS